MEDRDLLARLAGDGAAAELAFDEIFRAWYARLVRVAQSVVRDQAVAEEIAQDVMLELWRRRDRLPEESSPQAYLVRAARNRALNHVRHGRVEQRGAVLAAADPPHSAPTSGHVEAEELRAAYDAALAELTPRCREVFELSRVQGLRYAEIAAQLGVSVKAVEAQMGNALRTLRARLAAWLPKGGQL